MKIMNIFHNFYSLLNVPLNKANKKIEDVYAKNIETTASKRD